MNVAENHDKLESRNQAISHNEAEEQQPGMVPVGEVQSRPDENDLNMDVYNELEKGDKRTFSK